MSGYVFHCTPCGFPHAGDCVVKAPDLVEKADPTYEVVITVGSHWQLEHQQPGYKRWGKAGYHDGYEVLAIVSNQTAGGTAVQVREWNAPAYPVYTCVIGWWDPDGIGASDGGRNRMVPYV